MYNKYTLTKIKLYQIGTERMSEMKNNTENTLQTVEVAIATEGNNVQFLTTPTGRVTQVGTRSCMKCGRKEFHTKKFEASQNPEHLNTRYTLCKGVCVYCYCEARNRKRGTSLTQIQLEGKIKFYTDLLAKVSE